MPSPWLTFYRGLTPDTEGRYISEILAWDDELLEAVHDYIQWLFPLPERSAFNSDAPVLTAADIVEARADATVQANLNAALERMRMFYGLTPESAAKPKPWVCAADHNHLRLTRILRSLTLLGLPEEAKALHADISRYDAIIPERTKRFWRDALTE